ncbi:MAG TPA: DM13 domain-containing protein [Burkholderiaceae bacterium]|nr:DM13 domain-containing protein [Burkholderiaceae bacterium]
MKKILLLLLSHGAMLAIGFAAGIYVLPILIAPKGPTAGEASAASAGALFTTQFRRDHPGSDALHWGEGTVSLSPQQVVLNGRLAPGPDYKLYLLREDVQNRAAFLAVKQQAVRLGDVKTFDNFIVPVPPQVDVAAYNTVLVWCESFSMFIAAARYR